MTELTFYRIKTVNGYFASSFCGFTKDKNKALLDESLLNRNIKFLDDNIKYKIETVSITPVECDVYKMAFGRGDTYSTESVKGFIIAETKKYVYVVQSKGDKLIMSTVKKELKSDSGTYCFNTSSGFKYK